MKLIRQQLHLHLNEECLIICIFAVRSADSATWPHPLPGSSEWKQKRWREEPRPQGRGYVPVSSTPARVGGWPKPQQPGESGSTSETEPALTLVPSSCIFPRVPVMPSDLQLQAQPSKIPTSQSWPAGGGISRALIWHSGPTQIPLTISDLYSCSEKWASSLFMRLVPNQGPTSSDRTPVVVSVLKLMPVPAEHATTPGSGEDMPFPC